MMLPPTFRLPALALLSFVLVSAAAGCAASGERARGGGVFAEPEATGLVLGRTADHIRTVQLYRSGNEGALPILPLNSGETLTLEFDLLADFGETFSVYFYHADRQWRRDLLPVEYLRTFQSDEILDYEP